MRRWYCASIALVSSMLISLLMPAVAFAFDPNESDLQVIEASQADGDLSQVFDVGGGISESDQDVIGEEWHSHDENAEISEQETSSSNDDGEPEPNSFENDGSSVNEFVVEQNLETQREVDSDYVSLDEANSLSGQADSSQAILSYSTHVQNYGWQAPKSDGETSGTSGRGLRVESFRLSIVGNDLPEGCVIYRAQVQNVGWIPWVSDGQDCGTTGRGLRMEAIQICLTGPLADEFDIYYRVHVQNYGWLSWAKNGALAGSTGKSLRLEGIQVALVSKGDQAPKESPSSMLSKAFVDGTALSVSAHVQNVGWMRPVGSGKVAGTTGRSLRVEALRVSLAGARVPGGITGQAHVQNVGWQKWVGDGETAGTSGRSLRVEAVRYKLTGEAADEWDLYYRAHVQNVGWLSWAKNGDVAGTEGVSARIEAVQFVLCEKGSAAPREEFHFDGPYPLSGDDLVDSIVWRTVTEHGWKGRSGLRSAFNYVCSYPYKSMSNWPGPDTETWSVTFAKQMLVNGGGNCHRYASLMRWYAKALGYEARVVPGMLRGPGGSDHGWLEVDIDGTTYVVDAAVQNAYPEYNWFLVRYQDAKLKYYDLDGNRILK